MRTTIISALALAFFTALAAPAWSAPTPSATAKLEATVPATVQLAEEGKVNLNSADAESLKRELSGVGLAKAEAIVKHREANGPFHSVDELLEVKGIGKALLDRNRDKLMVK